LIFKIIFSKEPKEPAPEDMTKAQAVKKAYQDL